VLHCFGNEFCHWIYLGFGFLERTFKLSGDHVAPMSFEKVGKIALEFHGICESLEYVLERVKKKAS